MFLSVNILLFLLAAAFKLLLDRLLSGESGHTLSVSSPSLLVLIDPETGGVKV